MFFFGGAGLYNVFFFFFLKLFFFIGFCFFNQLGVPYLRVVTTLLPIKSSCFVGKAWEF